MPPLVWMPAYAHGGPFAAGRPLGVVVHSTESENGPGSAEAIAGPNWFGGTKAGTSSHKVVDRDSIAEGVRRNIVAYHCGPNGNGLYVAYEFCGRASWSAAKWREPEQLAMINNAAPHIASDLAYCQAPPRWLSLTQVARSERGLLTHNDVRLALGGTTHSDPGPNFPYAELLDAVVASNGPAIVGRIRECYDRVNGPALLGAPLHPELPTGDPQGRFQRFERGNVYGHPAVDGGRAHELHGEILRRFVALGNEGSVGWPTTDELSCPDRVGRFVHFLHGKEWRSIYWSPTTGPQLVAGGIRSVWESSGWERGPLGYPTGEELPDGAGFVRQAFEHGAIRWNLGTGRGELVRS